MKDVILKTAETKFLSRTLQDTEMTANPANATSFFLKHNQINHLHIFNNTNPDAVKHPLPVQGDSDGQRNGDEIYATGIRIAGSVYIPSSYKQATFKLFLVEYNDQVFPTGTTITDYNSVFHNVSTQTALDTFQHDRIKPKYLRTIRMATSDVRDDQDGEVLFKLWLPLKRKFTFRQDDSPALALGIKNKYTLMILPYHTHLTTTGQDIGQIRAQATMYYKDP